MSSISTVGSDSRHCAASSSPTSAPLRPPRITSTGHCISTRRSQSGTSRLSANDLPHRVLRHAIGDDLPRILLCSCWSAISAGSPTWRAK